LFAYSNSCLHYYVGLFVIYSFVCVLLVSRSLDCFVAMLIACCAVVIGFLMLTYLNHCQARQPIRITLTRVNYS